jgi:hypothetical protein
LGHIYTEEAAQALRALFLENHQEVLGDRRLKEAMAGLRALPAAAAAEVARAALAALPADSSGNPDELLGGFYGEVLAATQGGKVGQLGNVLLQTADAMHMRSRRLGFAVDAAAEGLADMVAKGRIDPSAVLPLLVEAYREQTGREGLARALARLVPAGAREIHQLILDGPDGAQRAAAVEILGDRAEAELQPVLLQACGDAITDIADRARFFLGQLPDAEDLAGDLLHAMAPADFQLGIQLVSEQRFRALVPDLLGLLKAATREDLVLQLVEALGAVGDDQVAEPLLTMLHTGQSLRLQTTLAQALVRLASPPVARALCAKADEIKLPVLHVLAVEALAAAHAEGRDPLPAEAGPALLEQVRRAWNDRNPWPLRLRLMLALQGVQLEMRGVWQELANLANEALAEKRAPSAWSVEELRQAQQAARELARRAG